ncbi:MAG: hypothetical protein WAW86_09910 [Gammaproteobacteria bacterium]
MDGVSSIELANTIIEIVKKIDLDPYYDNELVQAIQNEEENPVALVANWLGFHSGLKYQLIKNNHLPDKQHHILLRYLSETNLQKAIPSFILTSMDIDDYVHLLKAYQEICSTYTNQQAEGEDLDKDALMQELILAENKLDQILDRMFGGTCLGVRVTHRKSVIHPYQQLIEMILHIESGEKQQLIFTEAFNIKNIQESLIGLDIEKNENAYSIFCFSNMPESSLNIFMEQLTEDVSGSVVKGCAAPVQTAKNSDKLTAIAALQEFAKYPHVFNYLPDSFKEKLCPLALLPSNIIAMNQSYQEIKPVLERAKAQGLFDLDVDLFANSQKIKYLADEKEYKEIYRAHEQVINHASVAQTESIGSKYEIIRDLKHGKQIDLGHYMNDVMGDHEKLAYLLAVASSIFNHNKVNTLFEFENHMDLFTSEEILFLKQLRAECMALINDDLAIENDILHAGSKLLFQVNLD